MSDNADVKSDGTTTLFKAAADEVTYSGDLCKVQLVKQVVVSGAEGSKTASDIVPSNDYTHDTLLTPSTTAGPALVGRATDGTNAVVSAVNNAVLLIATFLGKLITLPYAHPAKTWSYAAVAGGLVTNAEQEVKAAVAGVRNYLTSMQVCNSNQTVGTELLVLDGPSGTVLWRGWAQFAGGGISAPIPTNIRGSINKSLIVKEVTNTPVSGVYGGVLVNCQGYEAAE